MGRFKAVISNRAGRCQTDVHKRSPALQLVMTKVMEEIRSADGSSSRGSLNGGECRMVVHDVVREKDLLPPAAAHIQGREIIQRTSCSDARKRPPVFSVPEIVSAWAFFALYLTGFGGTLRSFWRLLSWRFLRER